MKSLIQYLNESLISEAQLIGRQLFDELIKTIQKMKIRANWHGDCLAIISDDKPELEGYVTNVGANVLPESEYFKKNEEKMKYFGMFNTDTKCTTVWVGPEDAITKMYNNLKKEHEITLTELH